MIESPAPRSDDPALGRDGLAGAGGGMAALVRSHDWSGTPLGRVEDWPRSLRVLVGVVLEHPMPTILLWGPGLIQIYNDAYAFLAGAKHPAALGMPTRACWPEVWHINEPIYKAVMVRGESVLREDALYPLQRNGRPEDVYLTISYSPARDDAGRVAGVFITITETTRRVRAERRLRHSEALLAEAQQLAHVGSWNWDLATDLLTWSDEHYRIFGLERREDPMTFERGISFIHPEDLPRVRRIIDEALRDHTPYECSLRLRPPDGSIRFVHSRGRAVYDQAGQPVRMHGTIQDVTVQVRAEEAVRVANERLDLAVRGSNLGVWDVDLAPDGDYRREPVRFINVWEQLGYEPADFPTDAPASRALGHPDDLARVDEAIAACLAGEAAEIRVENRIRHKDGSYRWLLTLGKAVRDPSGRPVRLVGTVLDVTDRKRAEEALARAKAAAEEANRVKDEFLATLSHELRTPLAAILLWGQLLRDGVAGEGDRDRGLRAITTAAEAQNRMIEDLLDVSRMVSGKLRLDVREVDLAAVLAAAADAVRPAAGEQGVRLDVDLPPAALTVRGDPDRLRQVVSNLLTNAVKFTPAGGRVELRANRTGEAVRVTVRDTGRGITPEFLPHVFDRFRQADSSATRSHGGLGLGLAIVRQLVEQHAGSVTAESDGEGKGATFTVELPVAGAGGGGQEAVKPGTGEPGAGEPGVARPAAGATPLKPLAGLRILLVEDDAGAREALTWALTSAGAEVVGVESAAAAMAALTARPPDVLVSDIGLPGEDGYSLIRRVRASTRAAAEGAGRPVPSLALTAFARPEDRERALAAGFTAYATKPVNAAELVRTVAGLAGKAG